MNILTSLLKLYGCAAMCKGVDLNSFLAFTFMPQSKSSFITSAFGKITYKVKMEIY